MAVIVSWFSRLRLRRGSTADRALAAILLDKARRDRGHALIWLLFAEASDAPRDFLYRETHDGFYCVSRRPPRDDKGLWDVATKPYDPEPAEGQRLRFSLRASPVVARARPDPKRSIKVSLVTEARRALKETDPHAPFGAAAVHAATVPWLLARAPRLGLEVDAAGLRVDNYWHGKVERAEGARIPLACVDFEGTARVIDGALLRRALLDGVGRGKAYGCGLLLAKPVRAEA